MILSNTGQELVNLAKSEYVRSRKLNGHDEAVEDSLTLLIAATGESEEGSNALNVLLWGYILEVMESHS